MLPAEILALDWGATPAKRQLCRAVLRGKRYALERPVPVADPRTLELPPGALVAFDCTIGLPETYADAAGLLTFRDALAQFGHGRFERFFEPAATPEELSLERPFYPAKSGGASREHPRRVLGEAGTGLRACDRATGAGDLFWLVGPKQVGRSSLSVWRDVLSPRLNDVALWPFDGELSRLLASGKPVVAEMYPAFLIRTLGLEVPNKRSQQARARAGSELLERLSGIDIIAVRSLLLDGFGSSPAAEDAFDATLSCIALVQLLQSGHVPEPPPEARVVEGWILGL